MKRIAGWACLIALVGVGVVAWAYVDEMRNPSGPASQAPPRRPAAPPPPEVPDDVVIEPDERSKAGDRRDDNGLGMVLAYCPPGSFRMGAPFTEYPADGERAVRVTLTRGFWIGAYEVTQAEYAAVMGRSIADQRAAVGAADRPVGDGTEREHVGLGPDFPMYYVSHVDAVEFCRRLTETERAEGRLDPGLEYRLPTEAQWEYACRAGTATAYAFGADIGGRDANIDDSLPNAYTPPGPYLRRTTPVGSYPPNAWGLHDMHGNVFEWCLDGDTPALPGGVDPVGPESAPGRIYRGGGWNSSDRQCRSAHRLRMAPGESGSSLGFRVALVPVGG